MTDTQKPTLLIETSSLLSLMLSGVGKLQGRGYANLIGNLAENGVVDLATTDMIVGEFLGVMGPVYAEDIINGTLEERNIPVGYALRAERLTMIKEWAESGLMQIHHTRCGDAYLERIQEVLPYNTGFRVAADAEWPPSVARLQKMLLRTGSTISRAVKSDNLVDKDGETISSGRQDRGEISAADAVKAIQEAQPDGGKSHPIFVLFEGSDVRGRMLWRLSEPKEDQLGKNPPVRFDPNAERGFEQRRFRNTGNINFVTTKGFLAGLAYIGLQMDSGNRQPDARKHALMDPSEALTTATFEEAYRRCIVDRVNAHGLSRLYERWRDEPIGHLTSDQVRGDIGGHSQRLQPWKHRLEETYMGLYGAEAQQGLKQSLETFALQRTGELERHVITEVQQLLLEITALPPDQAQRLLGGVIESIGAAIKANAEKGQNRG